jgi:hypothetical protein
MPASKAQRALTAKRRTDAIALRLAGADYETIAERLGYSSRGAAYTDITRALEARLAEQRQEVDLLRQEELARLNRLQMGVWTAAVGGDPRSAEVALKIIDRRCKLLGLDAPQRLELVTMGAVEQEIRRLEAELGLLGGGVPDEPALRNGIVGGAEAGETP